MIRTQRSLVVELYSKDLVSELSEDYIRYTLGFKTFILTENVNESVAKEIMYEHLLVETWMSNLTDKLKKMGVDSIDKYVKQPIDAIKEVGANVAGISTAIAAVVKDSDHMKLMNEKIEAMIVYTKKGYDKGVTSIIKSLKKYNMPTFAKWLESFTSVIDTGIKKIKSLDGWKLMLGGLGLRIFWDRLNHEFKFVETIRNVADVLYDPVAALKEYLVDSGKDASSEEMESQIDKLKENTTEMGKALWNMITDKFPIVEELTTKAMEWAKGIFTTLMTTFAGPIAWVQSMIKAFKEVKHVTDSIGPFLSHYGQDDPPVTLQKLGFEPDGDVLEEIDW